MLPAEAIDQGKIRRKAISASGYKQAEVKDVKVMKRSIDARGSRPVVRMRVDVYVNEAYQPEPAFLEGLKPLDSTAKKVIVVGAGPAGYFAGLELLALGLQPIIFDRGKDVRARRRDLKAIQQDGLVNPHSNYCFGEGGAGTYSDGKLYTRSGKRGNIDYVLKLLVEHGAKEDILVDAHPHIGSNKLPQIVSNIRQTIEKYGGEVHFDSYVTDLIVEDETMKGVVVNETDEHFADATILATGHSARDIYYLLDRKKIRMEAKPYALGVRIEHPQALIDQLQYNQRPREENLPAASYRLAGQQNGRGVFSFCMCPGGLVVPASTAPGEIVVNGMSLSRRDSPYANSGMVVAVDEQLFQPFKKYGIFAGLEFQKSVEQTMFAAGDGTQKAAGQRMTDFVEGKVSKTLSGTSYIPGLHSAAMHELLPKEIYEVLRKGLMHFGKSMRGYMTEEANVIGTESRTSSPVRIPRDPKTLMNEQIKGFFPSGEGAGYAGGIISAAIDGQRVANQIAEFLKR